MKATLLIWAKNVSLRYQRLSMNSVVNLTDRPDMSITVYHGRKAAPAQQATFQTNCDLISNLFMVYPKVLKYWNT